jgi:hypothetical protein
MNNIVLYKTTSLIALLLICLSLGAQKPVIDLIPSSHQVLRSGAMIDTSLAIDSLAPDHTLERPSSDQHKKKGRTKTYKERRQIGPSMDSLLRRPENKKAEQVKSTGNIPYYTRKLHPVKFFISIIALK